MRPTALALSSLLGLPLAGCPSDSPDPVTDTTIADTQMSDTQADTAAPDTTPTDTTPPDTVAPDATTPDTTTPDTTTPDSLPEDTSETVAPPEGGVTLNEIVAGTLDGSDDWIELRNGHATETMDLEGWTLEDGGAAPWAIPAGTTLAPGARLVMTQTEFGFGLGQADTVILKDADGAEVDRVEWTEGAAPAGWSFGRLPDDAATPGAWQTLRSPTPGEKNASFTPDVILNEAVASDLAGGDDWVELLNLSGADVDLEGWQLLDDGGNSYSFGAGASIGTGVMARLVVEQTTFDFGLGKEDGVWLVDADGRVLDVTTWLDGENAAGQSRARIPDGEGPFVTSNTPTKGEPNAE